MGIILALIASCFIIPSFMNISIYKRTRKYPKRIKLEDVNFIEDNKKIEINMVSGKTEFIFLINTKKNLKNLRQKVISILMVCL